MEFSIAFARAPEGSLMPDQGKIAFYEGLLKSVPQIQVVSNDDVSSNWSILTVLMSVCLSINPPAVPKKQQQNIHFVHTYYIF